MDANRLDPCRTDARYALGEPRVLISRQALLHNVSVIRRRLAAGTRLCAMLKADAYGHGARLVADTLCNMAAQEIAPTVDMLAVASLDEAAALASAPEMNQAPQTLAVFRPLENAFVGRQRHKIEEAVHGGWVLTICSPAAAEDLARIALSCGRRAHVQVMVDTGMTRGGVEPSRLDALLEKIDSRPSLRLAGLYTHFANSDDASSPFTHEQHRRFTRATALHADRVTRHVANSGAIFASSQFHLDMIRPGLALYGVDPSGRPHVDRPLRPALKWTAPIVGIHEIDRGATVGYGQAWTATRRTRIGLLPVGYADGYPRCFSNHAFTLVHGQRAPVVGRVSMDLTTIDLQDVPQAQMGDEVTLLDSDPLSPVSVYALAAWAQTVPYEIFCNIGPRMVRVTMDDEEPIEEVPGNPLRLSINAQFLKSNSGSEGAPIEQR